MEVGTPLSAAMDLAGNNSVSSSSAPSRLGLLQCPNSAKLGWGDCLDDGSIVNHLPDGSKHDDNNSNNDLSSMVVSDEAKLMPTSENLKVGDDLHSGNTITEDSTSRKRPRPSGNDFHKDELSETEEVMKGGDDDNITNEQSTLYEATKQLHLSVSLDYEQSPKLMQKHLCRYQILTVTYHGGDSYNNKSSSSSNNNNDNDVAISKTTTTIVGTISGKAKIELLPLETEKVNMNLPTQITLDVFGYRISPTSNTSPIIINRPADWMNSLPISIIVQRNHNNDIDNEHRPELPILLRIRIQSIADDDDYKNNDSTAANNECYYSAYPEESYQLNILPPSLLYPGNYTTCGGSGAYTILEPWIDTLDKITSNITGCISPSEVCNKNKAQHAEEGVGNRLLIRGAKGVGKSTLLRYATNRILSSLGGASSKEQQQQQQQQFRPHRVAILDIDCGQAELSPPGLLTLTIVSKPLLSDPPIHMICGGSCNHYGRSQREVDPKDVETTTGNQIKVDDSMTMKHEAAYFFGDTTSKADPDTYIQMTSQLMRRYYALQELEKQQYGISSNLPLLVNTDGWVKGLGYEILSAVIGTINPGHIIHINGNTKAKTFDMSSSYVGSMIHVIQSFDESSLSGIDDDNRSCRSIDSRNSSTGTLLASASDHRMHRLCAYFLGGYDTMINLHSRIPGEENETISFHKERGLYDPCNIIGLTLASMRPYAVSFHTVRIYPPSGLLDSVSDLRPLWGMRGDMACHDVIDTLNGCIVGLCCNPDSFDAPSTSYNAGTGIPLLNCIGLGIVRSVDYSRKIFFVLTPVHPQLLANVTSFVGGNIHLGLAPSYRGVHSDSFPFLSCGHTLTNTALGGEVMKSRNNSRKK